MKPAFYSGASGLVAFQESMNVIGNNIANCNTPGYKAQSTSFQQLLNTEMYSNTKNQSYSGNGVVAVNNGIDASQGATIASQGSMDLAISGNGWFSVESNGKKEYTRDGTFSISMIGNSANLVNQSGAFVLDSFGNRIYSTVDSKTATIDVDSMLNKVGVFTFANPQALSPASSNCYLENAYTGAAKAASKSEYTVLTGRLEQSSVSLADEMVNLISAQRAYQLSARVVQTSDEIEQTVNSLRG